MAQEDFKASQQTAPEPELAPYMLEAARSSRSKCRTCKRKIEEDKLRLGILLEGPYGTGYLWHHLTCAARRRIEDVEAAYAQKAFADGLAVPPLTELQALNEKAEQARVDRKEPPYVERAPSGRSKCKHCDEPIAKDALRVVLAREISFWEPGSGGPDQRPRGMRVGGAPLGRLSDRDRQLRRSDTPEQRARGVGRRRGASSPW